MESNYSILANFFINDNETLLRMKDSLSSFKNSKSKLWIINIRGDYKKQASKFILDTLSINCKISFAKIICDHSQQFMQLILKAGPGTWTLSSI